MQWKMYDLYCWFSERTLSAIWNHRLFKSWIEKKTSLFGALEGNPMTWKIKNYSIGLKTSIYQFNWFNNSVDLISNQTTLSKNNLLIFPQNKAIPIKTTDKLNRVSIMIICSENGSRFFVSNVCQLVLKMLTNRSQNISSNKSILLFIWFFFSLSLKKRKQNEFVYCYVLPFDVLQLTTPNHPPFSLPSRVSTMNPHSITAQNIRDSSGPNHFDSRNFCTATELPNILQLLLLLLLLLLLFVVRWWFDVHHLIWPMTVLARERGCWSICLRILRYLFLFFCSPSLNYVKCVCYTKVKIEFGQQFFSFHFFFVFFFFLFFFSHTELYCFINLILFYCLSHGPSELNAIANIHFGLAKNSSFLNTDTDTYINKELNFFNTMSLHSLQLMNDLMNFFSLFSP